MKKKIIVLYIHGYWGRNYIYSYREKIHNKLINRAVTFGKEIT